MPNCLKPVTLSLLIALPLASFGLGRIELPPPEAPTSIRISNTADFWAKLKKSSIGQVWADPLFQDFIGNPDEDIWKELLFDGETDAEDEVLLEQLKMLNGEVVMAFDLDNDNPYIVAAMSAADFHRSLDLDEKLSGVLEDPFETIKSTFQDVEIIQHIDSPGTPDEESSWQAHVGTTFVLGYTKEWVEQCIVRLKKESIKEPQGNPVLNLNLPLAQFIRTNLLEDMKQGAAGQPAMYDPEVLFEALGLLGIDKFSTRIELKDNEMVADNNLQVSDLSKGIFTILDFEPAELPTVSFIPENISSLEVGRFNLLRFWQEIPNVLATAMPAVKPQFDMIMAMVQQQAGIDLEQDLLANLGTKYLSFSVAEAARQISVIAVDLKDSMAFKAGLETALAAPALQPQVAQSLEIEPFLDHTLYTVNNNDPENPIAFAVYADYLLYGHPEGLRQVIRSEDSPASGGKSFEQTELVKGLRKEVPPRAFGYSAIDWKKNLDVIIRELNKPEYTGLIMQNWAKSGSALPPPDLNKLPDTDHIASFFNVSYQYAEADARGLHQRIILKY
ncbi:hypothetical protein [Pontiella sulfatireligans]|uniref:DUF3352 domain-containing protein n=1 Tax=Pontiella sulfatireligans TaxID=2750658 RepID=A0A6C2UMP6_9BACT|nr:hypothetical protein [Pontiella sulfatireligans]VGO20376.1 hypothetical protein SCARR_02439 [Pontiella sulfatireligans]